jgi:hypothetical protein
MPHGVLSDRGAREAPSAPRLRSPPGRARSAAGETTRGGVAVSRGASGLERRSEIGVSAALCAVVGPRAAADGAVTAGSRPEAGSDTLGAVVDTAGALGRQALE